MASPYSVIVPVLDDGQVLEKNLPLIAKWCGNHQLIVVDGGSSDGSLSVAQRHSDIALVSRRGRAAQMNRGAEAATGKVLVFLHADTLPTAPIEELGGTESGWGFCRARLSPSRLSLRCVGAMMNLRARISRVATGDQMIFIGRPLFNEIGGYADIPLMEDVELCKRLRSRVAPRIAPVTVKTDSRRWLENGIWKTVWLMWRLRLAWWQGHSAESLARQYYKQQTRLPAVLVQFAREPVEGQVKTRLMPELGATGATKLHTAMVSHTCKTLCDARLAPVNLWVSGSTSASLFEQCRAIGVNDVVEQTGDDLGERMSAALYASLQMYERVIIVGSDAPELNEEYLKAALSDLDSHDLVLGPAEDGGYVLIGARLWAGELFEGIRWGTEEVLIQTLKKASELQLKVAQLSPMRDIDRPEDLRDLPDHLLSAINA